MGPGSASSARVPRAQTGAPGSRVGFQIQPCRGHVEHVRAQRLRDQTHHATQHPRAQGAEAAGTVCGCVPARDRVCTQGVTTINQQKGEES